MREGDTLRSLSELLEVEPAALRAANPNIDLDELVPGMELMIPESSVIVVGDAAESGADARDEAGTEEGAQTASDPGLSETADGVAAIPSEDGDGEPSEADAGADEEETEQTADAAAEAEGDRAQDASDTQDDAPQRAASEQTSPADAETPRPRYETISWKPFPKI